MKVHQIFPLFLCFSGCLLAADLAIDVKDAESVVEVPPYVLPPQWLEVLNAPRAHTVLSPYRNWLCPRFVHTPKNEAFWAAVSVLRDFLGAQTGREEANELIREELPQGLCNIILDYANLLAETNAYKPAIEAELPQESDRRWGYYSPFGNPDLLSYRVHNAALLYVVYCIIKDDNEYDFEETLRDVVSRIREQFHPSSKYQYDQLLNIVTVYRGMSASALEKYVLQTLVKRLPYVIKASNDETLTPLEMSKFYTPQELLRLAEEKIPNIGDRERNFRKKMNRISCLKKTPFLVLLPMLALTPYFVERTEEGQISPFLGQASITLSTLLPIITFIFWRECMEIILARRQRSLIEGF